MKCARLILATLSFSLLLVTGCETVFRTTGKPEPLLGPNEVVASVNGTTYRRKDMTQAVDALLKAQNVPAQEQAESQLRQEKSRDAVQKYTDTLRHAAKVTTIFPDLFL